MLYSAHAPPTPPEPHGLRDDDENGMVNKTEFRKALPMLGLKVRDPRPGPSSSFTSSQA